MFIDDINRASQWHCHTIVYMTETMDGIVHTTLANAFWSVTFKLYKYLSSRSRALQVSIELNNVLAPYQCWPSFSLPYSVIRQKKYQHSDLFLLEMVKFVVWNFIKTLAMTKFNRRFYITPDTWKMITVRLILPRFVCYSCIFCGISIG